ncbi:MAG TPA: hypothetical protein VF471_06115 [Pseudoxanthomonas sp.]
MLMALALCTMTGCQQQTQQVSEPAAKEPSDMRTTVPLVRHLDPDGAAAIEMEFDVPAQEDDPAPPVFIGIRIKGKDSDDAWSTYRRLRAAGISAEVHLYRLQESRQVAVALERVQDKSRSEVEFITLAPDGLVPGLTPADADFSTMQAAGLVAPGVEYLQLKFAAAANVPAGRYKAVVRLGQNSRMLLDTNSELLIAYSHKGK